MLSIDDKAQAFTAFPEQSNEVVKATSQYITQQVEEREERPLRVVLARHFGSVVGSFLEHLVFWAGKSSHCENGWFYQKRDEIYDRCGCDRREQTLARKVLRGDRAWKGKTFNLLHEDRPSRRKATHFRVDLIALADLLDVILPDELLPVEDLDDFDLLDEDAPESPYRATHETPEETPESPNRATESPNRATESPNRAASALSSTSSSALSSSPSLLQSGANQKTDSRPDQKNNDFETLEEHHSNRPVTDKRHSQDGATQSEEQAAREEVDEPKAPPLPTDSNLLADLREVLEPDSGRWHRDYAENVRKNYGKSSAYSPERLARNLADDPDLPYADRKADLVPCLRYLFWEWSHEAPARRAA